MLPRKRRDTAHVGRSQLERTRKSLGLGEGRRQRWQLSRQGHRVGDRQPIVSGVERPDDIHRDSFRWDVGTHQLKSSACQRVKLAATHILVVPTSHTSHPRRTSICGLVGTNANLARGKRFARIMNGRKVVSHVDHVNPTAASVHGHVCKTCRVHPSR